jgi:Spy/CpxP family protein refolding chaperone
MRRTALIPFLILALSLAAPAIAGQAGNQSIPTRLRENINTLYLIRMTQALDLTEEQTARIFPAITRIDKEKAALQRQLAVGVQNLRQLIRKEQVGDEEVLDLVREVRDLRRRVRAKDAEVEAVLEENLTPVQKAKFLVFSVDFYRGVNESLNRARQARPPVKRKP